MCCKEGFGNNYTIILFWGESTSKLCCDVCWSENMRGEGGDGDYLSKGVGELAVCVCFDANISVRRY